MRRRRFKRKAEEANSPDLEPIHTEAEIAENLGEDPQPSPDETHPDSLQIVSESPDTANPTADKMTPTNKPFYELAEGDRVLDEGTFVSLLDNKPVGREEFALIRRHKHGLLRRKGGGLTMVTKAERAGGTFHLHSRWDYDKRMQPVNTKAHVQAFMDNRARKWDAEFAFKGAKARFKLDSGVNPVDMKIAFERGWIVNVAPSAVPLYFLLGRYDLNIGGIQDFVSVSYSAEGENFGMGRNRLELEYLDPIEARNKDGDALILDYFVCDELPLKGTSRKQGKVTRRLHLWADENRRLYKVMEAQAGVLMTTVREAEMDNLEQVKPYPDMVWPVGLDPAKD